MLLLWLCKMLSSANYYCCPIITYISIYISWIKCNNYYETIVVCIYSLLLSQVEHGTRSLFKLSTLEFSFLTGCFTKTRKPNLSSYLHIAGGVEEIVSYLFQCHLYEKICQKSCPEFELGFPIPFLIIITIIISTPKQTSGLIAYQQPLLLFNAKSYLYICIKHIL